jgi:hypothetical protein
MKLVLLIVAFVALGCNSDQDIKELRWEELALVAGDFDHMGESLVRMGISYTEFEGFISQPVYNPEMDPDANVLKVEYLLSEVEDNGKPVMNQYDAIFLNSGTRGLGDVEYNSVLSDDILVTDEVVIENLLAFTSAGKSLVLSDWTGDLIEATWPDKIQFVNDSTCDTPPCLDASQMGASEAVIANVVDEDLQTQLGSDSVNLNFDFSYWTVMESVSEEVDVYLRGDIEYRLSASEGYSTLEDVPLLVGFNAGGGRVIFSSFHWSAQNSAVTDTILLHVAAGLSPSLQTLEE